MPNKFEIDNYMNILNSDVEKIKILSNIRFSHEGKKNNVRILGLKSRRFIYLLDKVPLLGGGLLKYFYYYLISQSYLKRLIN